MIFKYNTHRREATDSGFYILAIAKIMNNGLPFCQRGENNGAV
jgi:hypothetical protein